MIFCRSGRPRRRYELGMRTKNRWSLDKAVALLGEYNTS